MPRLPPPATQGRGVLPSKLRGLHLSWHRDALEYFIHYANANPEPVELPVAYWLTESPGDLTVDGFVRDTMAFLGELCDGANGSMLVVSSPSQTDQLSIRMGHMEMHPFVQACMACINEDTPLVVVRHVIDVAVPEAEDVDLMPPPGQYRQVFQ